MTDWTQRILIGLAAVVATASLLVAWTYWTAERNDQRAQKLERCLDQADRGVPGWEDVGAVTSAARANCVRRYG